MAEQETDPPHTAAGDSAEEGSHGDYKGEMSENEQKPMTAEISKDEEQDAQSKQEKTDIVKQELSQGEYYPEEKKAPETTSPPTPDGKKDDHVDGPDHRKEKKAPEKTSPPTLDGKKDDRVDGPDHRKEKKAPEKTSPPTLDGKKDDRVDGPDHPEVKKAPETTSPPTPDGKKDDHVDGPDEETPDSNATNTDAEEDDESCPEKEDDIQANTILTQTIEDVENIGPTIQETVDTEPAIPVVIGNRGGTLGITYLTVASLLVLVIAFLGQHLFQPKSPPQKDELRQIDIFLRELAKVKTQFPNQRAELWDRSKIHLLRHLQTVQPTEPVSLILTAGHRGERTLHCLAQRLASAFSSSLNASVLHIDGASKATQDSDQVKLDIDRKLQGAFEGDKPVAVINRFEELPPGSTLIFYRYCDHENAAYKNTFLIFTVLLGEEEEIPADTRLSTVEELVDDHLQKKFLSDGHPVSFDRMDIDKYSGLWSRISHLILPVAAEERIERKGC